MLEHQVVFPLGKLEIMVSEVNRGDAAFDFVQRQLSTAQLAGTAMQAECDQLCTFIGCEGKKHQDLKALLGEIQRCLTDHSSLIYSSRNMLWYDVHEAFSNYLGPIFDVVHKHKIQFNSASFSLVERHGKTLRQSACLIVSYLERRLSSSI